MGAAVTVLAIVALCCLEAVQHSESTRLTLEGQIGEGNVLDVSCEPGYESQGSVCKPCPENHFKDTRGDQLCQPCTEIETTYAVELCPCLPTQNRVLGCKDPLAAIGGTFCHTGPHSKLMAGCPVKNILRNEDLQVTETPTLSVSPSSSYAPTTAGTGNLTLSTSSPATMTDPVWDGSENHTLPDKGFEWSINVVIGIFTFVGVPFLTAVFIYLLYKLCEIRATDRTKPNGGAETEGDTKAGNMEANFEQRLLLPAFVGSADVQREEPARYNPMPSTEAQVSTPHNELDPSALGNDGALSSGITPSCRIDGASGGPDLPCALPSRCITQGSVPCSDPACLPAPGGATSPDADSVTTGSGPTSEARSYPQAHRGAQRANATSGSLAEGPASRRNVSIGSIGNASVSHESSDSGRQDLSATEPKTVWRRSQDEQGVQEHGPVSVLYDLKEHEAQSRTSIANLSGEAASPCHASVYSTNAAAESVAMSSCISVPEPIQVADSSHCMLHEMPTSS